MSETKQINTNTVVTTGASTIDIYTSYQTIISGVVTFFIKVLGEVVNGISFLEGELGFTKNDLPNFNASINSLGELVVTDDDTDIYLVDGLGNLISGTSLLLPVAQAASDILVDGFTAHWDVVTGATKYYLDIALDSQFNTYVSGYQNLDVGNVLEFISSDLVLGITYYYRVEAYDSIQTSLDSNIISVTTEDSMSFVDKDGNIYHSIIIGSQEWMVENLKTTKYADGNSIPNIAGYNDWFLPSKDELALIRTELYAHGIGGFSGGSYWSSSQYTPSPTNSAYTHIFVTDTSDYLGKTGASAFARAIRSFNTTDVYAVRDIGPAGGFIFYKNGDDYLECAPTETSSSTVWSNVSILGVTGTAIGTGQANTTAIIGQVGHTTSAAKLCNDLTSNDLWLQDTDGAYCCYDNDIANKEIYGTLYNWYVINNIHGLIDAYAGVVQFSQNGERSLGWRVPLYVDWEILKAYGSGLLPFIKSGQRASSDGTYKVKDVYGYAWTGTEYDSEMAYYRNGDSNYDTSNYAGGKVQGFSVRCMRDIP